MVNGPWQIGRALGELRRRHVFRVIGAYAITAWITVEVASVVLPALMAPQWVLSVLVFFALLGLPVAAVLAWAYDITPEGVVRTPPVSTGTAERIRWNWRWLDYLIIVGLLGILTFVLIRGSDPADPVPPGRTIAVLPFVDLSPDQDISYFGDGMAEAIMDALAGVPELRVAARTSSFVFRNGDASARQVAEALGVASFLEGSVRKSGNRLLISARLIDGTTGHSLWNDTFSSSMDDIFSVQESISRSIAGVLQVQLLGKSIRVDVPTTDQVAYEAYLRGRSMLRREATRESVGQAIAQFETALERDPSFGLARAGLCVAYLQRYEDSLDPGHAERALATCEQARLQVPDRAETQVARGHLYRATGQLQAAQEAFEQALELDPYNSDAMAGMSYVLELSGEIARAEALLFQAIELDPAYWRHYLALGSFYYAQGDYRTAAEQYRQAIRLEPDSARSYSNLGSALQMLGDSEGAAAAFIESIEREPTAHAFMNAGTAYYYSGRLAEAETMYRAAAELSPQDYRTAAFLSVVIFLQPGRAEEAQVQHQRAIRLIRERLAVNESDQSARAQLAITLLRAGEITAAEAELVRLAEDPRPHSEILRLTAEARLLLGQREQAISELEQVLAAGWPEWAIRDDPILNQLLGAEVIDSLLAEARTRPRPQSNQGES